MIRCFRCFWLVLKFIFGEHGHYIDYSVGLQRFATEMGVVLTQSAIMINPCNLGGRRDYRGGLVCPMSTWTVCLQVM